MSVELTESELNKLEERRFAASPEIDPNAPLEELETPDQLEERKLQAPKQKKKKVTKKPTRKGLKGVPENLRDLHPDAQSNPEMQITILNRIIKLCQREIDALVKESDNLEIFIEYYPLFVTDECFQRIRECVYLSKKANFELESFTEQRDLLVAAVNAAKNESQEPVKKGFFQRLFS